MTQEKKQRMLVLAGGALLIVALIVAAVVLLMDREPENQVSTPENTVSVPAGELLVEDIYEGKVLIPKFSYPKNTYEVNKFIENNGRITYDSQEALVGVDVSEFQGSEIDWQQVKASGVDFAILRIGNRGHTQGLMYVDECFERNYEEASAVGLSLGVYFFSQAISEEEAIEEAQFVLDTLGDRNPCMPIAFDWEPPLPSESIPAEDLRAYHCTGEEVTSYAIAFCEKIKEAGKTPMVYTNKSMAYEFFNLSRLSEYELWYAEYQPAPSLYYDFRIWQYTETGNVPGIGNVDLNICFKPYE